MEDPPSSSTAANSHIVRSLLLLAQQPNVTMLQGVWRSLHVRARPRKVTMQGLQKPLHLRAWQHKVKMQGKKCGGASICQHGHIKSRCKECGGASFCQHGRQKSLQGLWVILLQSLGSDAWPQAVPSLFPLLIRPAGSPCTHARFHPAPARVARMRLRAEAARRYGDARDARGPV